MTMANDLCDVCGKNKPIGVASTILPYSCAYCAECAARGAQPIAVFMTIYDDIGTALNKLAAGMDQLLTYCDGRYVTYREWAERVPGRNKK